jgi:hypothetical protein
MGKEESKDVSKNLAITMAKFDYMTILSGNFNFIELEKKAKVFHILIKKMYPDTNYYSHWFLAYRKQADSNGELMEFSADDYQLYFRSYVNLSKLLQSKGE